MNWLTKIVFYMGLVDAAIIMAGGIAVAIKILLGQEVEGFMKRVAPAIGVLVGSNIASALILFATQKLVG